MCQGKPASRTNYMARKCGREGHSFEDCTRMGKAEDCRWCQVYEDSRCECPTCHKTYKNGKQLQAHMKEKKHKELLGEPEDSDAGKERPQNGQVDLPE